MRRPHRMKLPGPKWYLRDFDYNTQTGRMGGVRKFYYISITPSLTEPLPQFLTQESTPENLIFSHGSVLNLTSMDHALKFATAAGAILVDERIGVRV
jgi:hypothetical protein